MTRRFGLFPKYAALIIALVATLLVASGAVGLYFSYRENAQSLVALQFEKAQGAATRIEQYVADIEQQVSWTALPGMDVGADAGEQRRIDYIKLLKQAPAVTEAAWIDAKGLEQLRIGRLAMDAVGRGTDHSASALFQGALGGRVLRSPVSFRKETEPYMTIARRAGTGGGVTLVDVNLKFVWEVVSRIQIGKAGLAYVVDDRGTLIAHPDISLVLKKSDLSALPQVAALLGAAASRAQGGLNARDALPARPGHVASLDEAGNLLLETARNSSGARVLAAHARIPILGWTVFVESPRAEAFAPLYDTLARMALVLAVGLLLSVAASFLLVRALVRPIQALQEGAARIGAGELDHRLEVKTGDELETLAGDFNRMAAELKASYAGLERKVDERTAELTEALAQQTATAEVLRVISSSVADAQPVFEKILASCQHLFASSEQGVLLVRDDGRTTLGAHHGPARARLELLFAQTQYNLAFAQSIRERRLMHFQNVLTDVDVPDGIRQIALQLDIGPYSQMFAPMVWEGACVGALYVTRTTASGFSQKERELLKTFADQAVIAIQNARLFHEAQDKTAQLEAANRHKSEFLANMSHELRTPLNDIIGFSEVLTEQMFGAMNDKQLEYLHDIHSSGHHLLNLINDVLDLSKIEAGRMELDLSCFDLNLLLEHSAMLVRERAQRHGLGLNMEVGDALNDWVADARKVKQTVVNLLSNAVKFTPPGGTVTVRARRLNTLHGQAGDWAEIAVIDSGIGIKPEDQALVFEEFRQASGDVLRKSEGTGLGLALVKRFVELHGGTVALSSAPGAGSTFTITLPQQELQVLQ